MTVHRIMLADDHPLLLRGLADLIALESDFEVVGTASTGRQALAVLDRTRPDVAILDIAMPDLDGLAVLRTIRHIDLDVRVIFLSASMTPAHTSEALALGAWGLLLKEMAPDLLIDCLRTVARGGRWHPEEMLAQVTPPGSPPFDERRSHFTRREREIVDLVCRGLSNRAIADEIGAAEGTVKIHLHNIFRKLKVSNRTSLVALLLDKEEFASIPSQADGG